MPVRLHVIYAGRGDAMLIEDNNRLILLDGGPRGYAAGDDSGAPYYRYVMSALREVSASMGRVTPNTIAPDAVIASHADEDHYGGIKRLFQEFLATQRATTGTAALPLVFNGPFVTQVFNDASQPGQQDLAALLTGYAFTKLAPNAVPAWLTTAYAFSAAVAWSRPAVPLLGRTWSVDTSVNNLASVLMYHRARQMVFTGDSVGHLIDPFLTNNGGGQPLTIFKVPHHGSMRNSQRVDPGTVVPRFAGVEYALLCLLSKPAAWTQLSMPARWRAAGPRTVARKVLLGLLPKAEPPFVRKALQGRFDDAIANLAAGNPSGYTAPVFDWSLDVYKRLIDQLESMTIVGSKSPSWAGNAKRGGKAGRGGPAAAARQAGRELVLQLQPPGGADRRVRRNRVVRPAGILLRKLRRLQLRHLRRPDLPASLGRDARRDRLGGEHPGQWRPGLGH